MAQFTPYLYRLWEKNKKLRKKAQRLDISPQSRQAIPPRLRSPEKGYGFIRAKGLRGSALLDWLIRLDGIYQDNRVLDFINFLHEKNIVDSDHNFTDRQGPLVDLTNEHLWTQRLAEVRDLIAQGKTEWQACGRIAADWALGKTLEAGARQLYERLNQRTEQ
jgi:hypothetical protein